MSNKRSQKRRVGAGRGRRGLILAGIGLVTLAAVAGLAWLAGGSDDSAPPVDQSQLVTSDAWQITGDDATVTVVEFLDFECEACRAAHPNVQQILQEYDGRINYVVRNFPNHNNSVLAAQAAEAAGEQGKYWEMFNLLFERQGEWGEKREPQTEAFISYARELQLDMPAFEESVASGKFIEKINADKQAGLDLGVNATPTFFINGEREVGVISVGTFRAKIDAALEPAAP